MDSAILMKKQQRVPMYSWWVLGISVICYMAFFIGLNTISVFGTVIQSEWGISSMQLSMLTTASMITFCIFPVIGGNIASKFGVKLIVVIGLTCNIISAIFLPTIGTTYAGLIVLRVLQGCSGGLMNSSLAAHLSRCFPKKQRGFATGILMGFLGCGFSVTSFIGPRLLSVVSNWQMASMIMIVIASAFGIVLYVLSIQTFEKKYPGVDSMDDLVESSGEDTRESRFEKLPKVSNMSEIIKSSRVWCTAIYGAGTAVTLYGLAYALPLFLVNGKGMDYVLASTIIGTTFLCKLVAAPIGGLISDKVFHGERFQINIIGSLVAGIMILLLPNVSSGILSIYMCVMFFAASLYGGTFWTWANELSTPDGMYRTSGFITTVSNVGAVIIAPLLGIAIDVTNSTLAAVILIGVATVISTVAAYFSKI